MPSHDDFELVVPIPPAELALLQKHNLLGRPKRSSLVEIIDDAPVQYPSVLPSQPSSLSFTSSERSLSAIAQPRRQRHLRQRSTRDAAGSTTSRSNLSLMADRLQSTSDVQSTTAHGLSLAESFHAAAVASAQPVAHTPIVEAPARATPVVIKQGSLSPDRAPPGRAIRHSRIVTGSPPWPFLSRRVKPANTENPPKSSGLSLPKPTAPSPQVRTAVNTSPKKAVGTSPNKATSTPPKKAATTPPFEVQKDTPPLKPIKVSHSRSLSAPRPFFAQRIATITPEPPPAESSPSTNATVQSSQGQTGLNTPPRSASKVSQPRPWSDTRPFFAQRIATITPEPTPISPSLESVTQSPQTPAVKTPPSYGIKFSRSRSSSAPRPFFAQRIATNATATTTRTDSFLTALDFPTATAEGECSAATTERGDNTPDRSAQVTVREVASQGVNSSDPESDSDSDSDNDNNNDNGSSDRDMPKSGTTPLEIQAGNANVATADYSAPKEPARAASLTRTVSSATSTSRSSYLRSRRKEVQDDDNAVVSTSETVKTARQRSVRETSTEMQSRIIPDGGPTPVVRSSTNPVESRLSTIHPDASQRNNNRDSILSTTSNAVIEATIIKVGTPKRNPSTLRHMRKTLALRAMPTTAAADSSASPVLRTRSGGSSKRSYPPRSRRHDSTYSNSSTNSTVSNKARKEVIQSGGIPVAVVPVRTSSLNGGRPKSLRSTNSRPRSVDTGSSSRSASVPRSFESSKSRPRRATVSHRSASVSRTSTRDSRESGEFAPVVPPRRSSLSAPTSRVNSRTSSRAGSMTTEASRNSGGDALRESLKRVAKQRKAHEDHGEEAIEDDTDRKHNRHFVPPPQTRRKSYPYTAEPDLPSSLRNPPRIDDDGRAESSNSNVNSNKTNRRPSVVMTPRSQLSTDKSETGSPEITEAVPMNIYPHSKSSVVMLNHRASVAKGTTPRAATKTAAVVAGAATNNRVRGADPAHRYSYPNANAYSRNTNTFASTAKPLTAETAVQATPPQQQLPQFAIKNVDSPLKNPRPPPEPPELSYFPQQVNEAVLPVLALHPATPSGMTTSSEHEKMLGNFYDTMYDNDSNNNHYDDDDDDDDDEDDVRQRHGLPLLLQRTLSLGLSRRDSERPGILERTFSRRHQERQQRSQSRSRSRSQARGRRGNPVQREIEKVRDPEYPVKSRPPRDETRLHPFWRPANHDWEDSDGSCDCEDCIQDCDCQDCLAEQQQQQPPPRRGWRSWQRRRRGESEAEAEEDQETDGFDDTEGEESRLDNGQYGRRAGWSRRLRNAFAVLPSPRRSHSKQTKGLSPAQPQIRGVLDPVTGARRVAPTPQNLYRDGDGDGDDDDEKGTYGDCNHGHDKVSLKRDSDSRHDYALDSRSPHRALANSNTTRPESNVSQPPSRRHTLVLASGLASAIPITPAITPPRQPLQRSSTLSSSSATAAASSPQLRHYRQQLQTRQVPSPCVPQSSLRSALPATTSSTSLHNTAASATGPRRQGSSSLGRLGLGGLDMGLGARLQEARRVRRSRALRGMISGPRDVRDGVGEVVRGRIE